MCLDFYYWRIFLPILYYTHFNCFFIDSLASYFYTITVIVIFSPRYFIQSTRGFQVDVEDYGTGIPQEALYQLGQPFTHVSTIYSTSGTGLGLYIVKNIVLAHEGMLEIHTREKYGTLVSVLFH